MRRERDMARLMLEEKENALGALHGSRLLPLCRPQPLSDVEDYTSSAPASRHHPAPSFLPEILSNTKPATANKVQPNSPPQLTQYWTYATGHGGSVEHWKKIARKAELEMHLEQEQHKSDRDKDLDSIHRLRCRISVLEGAAIDRDVMIEKQRRKINVLKTQIGGINKMKDYFSRGVSPDMQLIEKNKVKDSPLNPLRKLAIFQVDLLVNTKMLLSTNDAPIYETKAGDILGLSVKVKGVNDKNTREILCNTNVIRTDEVMEAIKGQPIDNFSLWPDLVSSWKWEKSTSKGWVLVCIKWRFLFKNIFPEISEPLQVLTIKQATQ